MSAPVLQFKTPGLPVYVDLQLNSLGLVRYPKDRHVAATELLFPEALR